MSDSDKPFPVKNFRKWQNVGVSKDDRDTASLEHITEGSLTQTGPTQHHTERGLLCVHMKVGLRFQRPGQLYYNQCH